MIDLEYLAFLENILTDNRKESFKDTKQNQTFYNCCGGYFSNAQYQCSNASCEIFEFRNWTLSNSVREKSIDKEIAMGAQKSNINTFDSITNCLDTLKVKAIKS
jgi:tRNA (guanosine-2'-O-)-methyltransferase